MAARPSRLDPTIHAANRLQVCAMLSAARSVEFAVLQDHLGVSASVLSKHLTRLADAGYVRQERADGDTRRIRVALTRAGRAAYDAHVTALRAIVDSPQGTSSGPGALT